MSDRQRDFEEAAIRLRDVIKHNSSPLRAEARRTCIILLDTIWAVSSGDQYMR